MNTRHMVVVVVVLAVAGGAAGAYADPGALNPDAFDLSGALDREVAPTRRALELAVGGGYTQGFGGAGSAGDLGDLTGAGADLEVQVGVRLGPRFAVGAYGTLARFRRGDEIAEGTRAHGATAGGQVVWHTRQARSLDPWISAGAGWRGLWLSSMTGPANAMHGVELLRVQLGIDYRFSPALAITPVIGVAASLFLIETAASSSELTEIRDNRLNMHGFTGVLGRFDLGG